jgi:hypothetical protein
MRTKLVFVVVSLLALFAALGSFMPSATQAAPAARPSSATVVTGTLVATPQSTLPTTLLLQTDSQSTMPVMVTSGTTVVNGIGGAISLSALSDGDTLQVTGDLNGAGGINATLIVDTSIVPPPTTFEVKGTLTTAPPGALCLANASVIGSAAQPRLAIVGICASGQLPVYLAGNTSIVDRNGNALALGSLAGGDTLQVTGTFSNGQFTASVVQDLTQPVTPTTFQVSGTLVSAPSGALCLANASVIGSAAQPRLAIVGICASGQLPVYLTGNTSIVNNLGQGLGLGSLQGGDTLHVTGSFSNGLFTASQIVDVSQPRAGVVPGGEELSVQGELATTPSQLSMPDVLCLQNPRSSRGRRTLHLLANTCAAGQLPVYVNGGTALRRRDGAPSGLDQFRAGDTLQVSGIFRNGQFDASQIVDVTIQRSYTVLVGTVQFVTSSYIAVLVRQSSAPSADGVLVRVYIQRSTQLVIGGATTSRIYQIQSGQAVTVLAVYNSHQHRCNSTFRVIVH